jgi:hypothetical protein
VTTKSKIEEVQFYTDRSKDALLTLIRSVLQNPRISDVERLEALKMMAEHHGQIAEFIAGRILEGERKGMEMAHAKMAPAPKVDPSWDA